MEPGSFEKAADGLAVARSHLPEPFDPGRPSALLVIDVVNHQVQRDGYMIREHEDAGVDMTYYTSRLDELLIPNLVRLIEACHSSGVRVIHLRGGSNFSDFSDGHPISRRALARWGAVDGSHACRIIDQLPVDDRDLSLLKVAPGGFHSTSLDRYLRNMGVEQLLYTGVVTNGCVLATLTAGFDLGYSNYLVRDATAAHSQRLQDATEFITRVYLAALVETSEIVELLAPAEGGYLLSRK